MGNFFFTIYSNNKALFAFNPIIQNQKFLGGSLFAIHSECEVYNPGTERWYKLAPMSVRRSRAGVVGINSMLYVVGGYDGTNDLATAESFNPQTNKVYLYIFDRNFRKHTKAFKTQKLQL